jgi:hypothetical protein
MPELPGRDAFFACLHTRFRLADDPAADFALELVEVTELKTAPQQQSFSVYFKAPANRYLPQQIYRLAHDRLGELDLFLVPVGRQEGAFLYEAAFNCLLPPG